MPITDNQPMSETKLPSEVMQVLQSEFQKQDGYHYWNGEESVWVEGNREIVDAAIKGATITATHYEQHNKRLVELLKDQTMNYYIGVKVNYGKAKNKDFEDYWQKYCQQNEINQNV